MATTLSLFQQRRRLVLLLAGPLVLGALATWYFLVAARWVETDNAYVRADVVAIAPQVTGPVVEVLVHENAPVAAGAVLFRIDPEPFRLALAQADAKLADTSNHLRGLVAGYQQALAAERAAASDAEYLARELARKQALVKEDVVSASRVDQVRNQSMQAEAKLRAVRDDLQRLEAELGGDPRRPIEQQAQYLLAQAARDKAALDLEHCEVRAPFAGVPAQVEIQPGSVLAAGKPAFALVRDGDAWVEANLKETQLDEVRVGQTARITVDAYPDREWQARVLSISPATGAEFSVLPAQNATGNWVKVVQRVAVKLAVTPLDDAPPLRAGMSAVVKIDLRSAPATEATAAR